MPDEEVQERGREGVGMVKTWLEATTWMQFPFNAYEDGARCMVPTLGKRKKFDLRGFHLGDKNERRTMSVECKRYKSKGKQLTEFRRFLAIAYSAHVKAIELYGEWAEDFMWVTSNPFETDKWANLCTEDYMLEVLSDGTGQREVLGDDHEVDEKLARDVARRTWLLVFEEKKQMRVTLTSDELKQVMTLLKREGVSLWQR